MFGKRLKILREKHHLSQQELGNKLSLAKQTISGYENGTRKPDQDILVRFADYFEVSVDYLLGRTDKLQGSMNFDIKFIGIDDDPYQNLKEHLEDIEDVVKQAVEDGIFMPEEIPEKIELLKSLLMAQVEQSKKAKIKKQHE